MKEREPNELTTKSVTPTLKEEGNIFMAEPGQGEVQQVRSQEPSVRSDTPGFSVKEVRSAWGKVNEGRAVSVDEKRTQEMLIERGVMPIAGGSGDEPGAGDEGSGGEEASPDNVIDLNARREEAKRQLQEEVRDKIRKKLVEEITTGQLTPEQAAEKYAQVLGSEEEQLKELREFKGEKKTFGQVVNEASQKIEQATDIRQGEYYFTQILSGARQVVEDVEKGNFDIRQGMDAWFDGVKRLVHDIDSGAMDIASFDLSDYQNTAGRLTESGYLVGLAKNFEGERRERGSITQPESLEDLIGLIEHSELPIWRRGGERALTDREGNIQMDNFLGWVRDKIMYNHEFNPDGNIDLFSNIYIPTPYRQIGLGEIIATPRYFRKEVKNGEPVDFNEYEKLRDHLLYEVWLFQNSHNFDVKYRLSSQGNEEKAIEALMEIHALNIFTKNKDRLFNILTLPSLDHEQVKNILEGKERTEAGVGQAIRQSILAYNYLYEINGVNGPDGNPTDNMFEKVLGEEGTLEFYRAVAVKLIKDKYKGEFSDTIGEVERYNKGKKFSERRDLLEELMARDDFISVLENGGGYGDLGNADLVREINIYRSHGMRDSEALKKTVGALLKKTHSNSSENAKGVEDLNIFSAFGKQPYLHDLVREGIRNAVGREQDLRSEDYRYAEHWAFSMAYWTGISARGDVNAQGFDGLSKIMNFKDYRIRQAGGKGSYGDLETLFGINKMALTMWEALRVKDEKTGNEKTLLEALQGGRGNDSNLDDVIKQFSFSEGSQEAVLTAQHYPNILGMYKLLMTEHGIDFDQFLTKDNLGRMIIDHKKAEKIRKEWIKFLRYGFDMANFYYDRDVRGWYKEFNSQTGKYELKVDNKPLGEFMFSKKVREMGMYDLNAEDRKSMERNPDGTQKSLYDHAYREKRDENGNYLDRNNNVVERKEQAELVLKNMSRNLFAYLVSTELWRHRNYFSTNTRYSLETFDTIEQYLRTLPLEIAGDANTGAYVNQGYFGKKEFKTIRHEGRVDPNRLELENLGLSLGYSTYGALLEMLKVLTKQTMRVA